MIFRGNHLKLLSLKSGWVGGRSGNGTLITTIHMTSQDPQHTSTQTPRCVIEKHFLLLSFLTQQKTTLIFIDRKTERS